jgi:hypothetical protein
MMTIVSRVVAWVTNNLLLLFGFLTLSVISCVLQGFVFTYLWKWFMIPFGMKSISLVHAIGLIILLDFGTYHYYDAKSEDNRLTKMLKALKFVVLKPLTALLLGYIAHLLM